MGNAVHNMLESNMVDNSRNNHPTPDRILYNNISDNTYNNVNRADILNIRAYEPF